MVALSDERIILALIAKAEPRLRRRFMAIVAWLRERHDTSALADLIAAGRAADALSRADIVAASRALGDAINNVYLTAGRELAATIAEGAGELVHLDQSIPRVIRHLQDTTQRLLVEMGDEQIAVARAILISGIQRGIGPREMARELRATLGLTEQQYGVVANYRRLLEQGSRDALERALRDRRFDASIERAAAGGDPLSTAEIDRMVERYAERMTAWRAETFARTEAIGAAHRGTEEMWQQAADRGVVDVSTLYRTWRATHDRRTRESHAAMNGQERAFGAPFITGDGNAIRYPHDLAAPVSETINCRCAVITRVGAPKEEEVAPELVTLPPPPPDPFTAEERAAYQDRALEQLDRGREDWNEYVRALEAGEVEADDVVRQGFTFSDRDVEAMRQAYAAKLTPAELDAALFYSNMGDNVLNGAARYNLWASDPRAAVTAQKLDSAIAKSSMPQDAYVARGMRGEWARQFAEALTPGDLFEDPGYISTAATKPFKGEVQMRVLIPKGTPAAPIPSAYTDAESEFLLPRGTRFRVVSIESVGTPTAPRWNIEVEVVP